MKIKYFPQYINKYQIYTRENINQNTIISIELILNFPKLSITQ